MPRPCEIENVTGQCGHPGKLHNERFIHSRPRQLCRAGAECSHRVKPAGEWCCPLQHPEPASAAAPARGFAADEDYEDTGAWCFGEAGECSHLSSHQPGCPGNSAGSSRPYGVARGHEAYLRTMDACDGLPAHLHAQECHQRGAATTTTTTTTTSFTAFYCLTHDQGALVEGQHDELPEEVRPCGAAPARDCDYVSHGRLEVEGDRARAVDFDLDRDYDRYAGGWEREYFASEVYLRTGEKTAAPPALAALLAPRAPAEPR